MPVKECHNTWSKAWYHIEKNGTEVYIFSPGEISERPGLSWKYRVEGDKYWSENRIFYDGNNIIPVMRGIYEHSDSNTGRPLLVYIFDTQQTNTVILISGFVNYPGHAKLSLLKQLEIMAITLRKEEQL